MNEDDADQGRGLDTKYRIDSAQGESLSISFFSSPPLAAYARGGYSSGLFSDASPNSTDNQYSTRLSLPL
jgi:hypothetical protein